MLKNIWMNWNRKKANSGYNQDMVAQHKKIPIGVDNFRKLLDPRLNFLFVDKSLFLKELIDEGNEVSLIIRPRRWGKTLNMSMVQHFFAPTVNGRPTAGMFDNLQIASVNEGAYLEYQGQFSVLFITFKDAKQRTLEGFLEKTAGLIQMICFQYPELSTSVHLTAGEKKLFKKLCDKTANTTELCTALYTLSQFLYKHYDRSVFILIDEYDTPLNAAYDTLHFDELVSFFKDMFGSALKGNDALEQGILTGILRLSKNKMLSDLNNLNVYSLLDEKFGQYFGFSAIEVQNLFERSNKTGIDMQAVQTWYNGYHAGNIENIYNPWSILNCLRNNGKLKAYWIKTGNEELLKTVLLGSPIPIKEKINLLLLGQPIESIIDEYYSFDQIQDNEEALWSLLWALGYLKTVGEPQAIGTRYKYQLLIPNQEIFASYSDVFQIFMNTLPNVSHYDSFLKNLSQGNVEIFIKELETYMSTIPSWFDLPKESHYHTFILGLTASLSETHHIYSNREIGYGRPDMLLIPKDSKNTLGIILEFKREAPQQNNAIYEKLALAGLNQIDIKKYDAFLIKTPTIHNILKMCIVFYAKQFVCKWEITPSHPTIGITAKQ